MSRCGQSGPHSWRLQFRSSFSPRPRPPPRTRRQALPVPVRLGAGSDAAQTKPADQAPQADERRKPRPRPSRSSCSKTDAEWRRILTRMQYAVTRQKATEPAFSGKYATGHYPRHVRVRLLRGRARSTLRPSSIRVPAGRASIGRPTQRRFRRAMDYDAARAADRGDVPALRRPSGPRLRRRSDDDRPAILHQFDRHQAQAPGRRIDRPAKPGCGAIEDGGKVASGGKIEDKNGTSEGQVEVRAATKADPATKPQKSAASETTTAEKSTAAAPSSNRPRQPANSPPADSPPRASRRLTVSGVDIAR